VKGTVIGDLQMAISNQPFFVLHIIDGGLSRITIPGRVLVSFTSTVELIINEYLQEHGYLEDSTGEYKTDDGYATILQLSFEDIKISEPIWTYSFDGDTSVSESLYQLREQWS